MSHVDNEVSSVGITLDEFLKEQGIYEEVSLSVAKKVYTWQLEQAIRERNVTKVTVAKRMKTSRAQLERVLDPKNDAVSIGALIKAAASVGKRIKIELVDV